MNDSDENTVRKYQIKVTKINTGETETHLVYALGISSVKKTIERLYNVKEYKIHSLKVIRSIVNISIEPYCPN